MSQIDLVTVGKGVDLSGSLVLITFPSPGQAAVITGEYLRQSLQLPSGGWLYWDDHPPLVTVENGHVSTPLTFHGGEIRCKGGLECGRLWVVSCPVPLPNEAAVAICAKILALAKSAKLVLCLDAVQREADDHTPDVYWLASNAAAREMMETTGTETLERGILQGATAQILLDATRSGQTVGALLVEAKPNIPDHYAAVALIQAVDKLVPTVTIDSKPLEQQAQEIQKLLEAMQKEARAVESGRKHHNFI